MLRFCCLCKKIRDERDMITNDVCDLHSLKEANSCERTVTDEEVVEPGSKASSDAAGEVECGPYLPGCAPAQGATK